MSSSEFSSQCIQKSEKLLSLSKATPRFRDLIPERKLLIDGSPYQNSHLQKTTGFTLPLAVMINPRCALNNSKGEEISLKISKGKILDQTLEFQVIDWKVSNQEELDQFEQDIEADDCVFAAGQSFQYDLTWAESLGKNFNDPYFNEQGHLTSLNYQSSYGVFYNVDRGVQTLSDEESVVVAVVDTGVAYTHGDLKSSMWKNSDGHVGVNASTIGLEGVDEDYDPFETSPFSHGTHVAGIIAATSNNGKGGIGVASGAAKIMAIRAFNSVEGSSTEIKSNTVDIAAGMSWAVDRGAHIINLSVARAVDPKIGEPIRDQVLELAIRYALERNVFVVFAAGNGGGDYPAQEIDDKNFTVLPARYGAEFDGAITVGSIDGDSFLRSSFSHFGSKFVEISAPGRETSLGILEKRGVLSAASPVFVNNKLEDKYHRLEGTSMSAPMVSAAAALAIALIKKNTGITPTPPEIERLLKASTQTHEHLQNEFSNGGTLDLARLAVKVVVDYDMPLDLGPLKDLQCQ